ncbi:TPA: hypothetical protein ACYZ3Z_002316 [Escherichia coli]
MTLPLRDYYPIERAAKLLDCDIDDLIHWAVTGCIRICIKIESAYGVLNIPDEKDVVNFDCLRKFMDSEPCKSRLSDLDAISERAAEHHGFNYIKTKSRIIFDSMCESLSHSYVAPKFGDIAIDTAFALLNYYNRGLYYGENYHIYSVYRIATDERAVAVVPPVFKGIQEKYHKYFVEIGGIFALGGSFFANYDFNKKFKANRIINSNIIIASDVDIHIGVIVTEDVSFDIGDLYILKNDFLKIQNATSSNSELRKDYVNPLADTLYLCAGNNILSSEDGEKDICTNKNNIERLSKTMKDFFRAMLVIHYKELENNPVKLADILTAEAREAGLNMRFDKSTISRWIKASSQ